MVRPFFADLHVHLGVDHRGKPIKISASKHLTLENILLEASRRKGIDIIGVIDAHVPNVLTELTQLIAEKKAYEQQAGGIVYENVTLILGSEIEVYDMRSRGPIHVLAFLPNIKQMQTFSTWLSSFLKNITLSSQRFHGEGRQLQQKVKELGGLFIPAHVFTPFKSLYGRGVKRSLTEVFDPDLIDAIELGLSADTEMADQISELHRYPYLTNSDSHSLTKIAREYQQILLKEPTFNEFSCALQQLGKRRIYANYGLNPKLGKYYRTVCKQCLHPLKPDAPSCPKCHTKTIIKGVRDRIQELATNGTRKPERPPYIYQVPLEFIPGLGPKTLQRLLEAFGTEMNIIHHASYSALKAVVKEEIAQMIIQLRIGKLPIVSGGGGKYGTIRTQ